MLEELKWALLSKRIEPIPAIIKALGCSKNTARNKLNGTTRFMLQEAFQIIDCYFQNEEVDIRKLFSETKQQDAS